MAACIPITQEKIRAELYLGTTLIAKTPFIKSFSVQKERSSFTNTFNITFEMLAGMSFPIGEHVIIKAGIRGSLKSIFTGTIESTTAQPAFGKPSYFSVSLSGRGVLSDLENKKFSRRLKSDGQGMYCMITGGPSNRPSDYYSLSKPRDSGNGQVISGTPNPANMGGQQSPLLVYPGNGGISNSADGGIINQIASRNNGVGLGDGGGGLGIHTHEDLDQGGPAFGVYSAD